MEKLVSVELTMRIIGFDPGIDKCGYGVIEVLTQQPKYVASGRITSVATQPLEQKLAGIQKGVDKLIDQYSVISCAVEDLFVGHNLRGALHLGMAHGAILAALGRRQLALSFYTPAMVKKTVAGNGRATKQAITKMVQRQLAITGSFSLDSSDALAVALCHFYVGRKNLS